MDYGKCIDCKYGAHIGQRSEMSVVKCYRFPPVAIYNHNTGETYFDWPKIINADNNGCWEFKKWE